MMKEKESPFPRYDFSSLDRRDLQILRLVAFGCTSQQIAQRLRMSDGLVRKRRSAMIDAYGVEYMTPLCVSAAIQGLID